MRKHNRKRVDFSQLYREFDYEQRSVNPVFAFGVILAVILIVAGGYYTFSMYMENESLKSEIREVESYLTDPNNVAIVNEVLEKDAEILKLQLVSDDLDSMKEIVDLYPDYDFEFNDTLSYEDVDIMNVEYYVSGISIEAVSDDVDVITDYVRYLKDTGLFYDVNFYGFDAADGDYRYMITAVIARGDNNE